MSLVTTIGIMLLAEAILCLFLVRKVKQLARSHRVLVAGMPGLEAIFSAQLPPDRNYCEILTTKAKSGAKIVITVQRMDRKTPHQLRREAEQERDELRAKLEALSAKP